MTDDDITERKKENTNPPLRGTYNAGLTFNCRVVSKQPHGYFVLVGPQEDPGYLPTKANLEIGATIYAQFVCISQGQVMVHARQLPLGGDNN